MLCSTYALRNTIWSELVAKIEKLCMMQVLVYRRIYLLLAERIHLELSLPCVVSFFRCDAVNIDTEITRETVKFKFLCIMGDEECWVD